MKDLEKEVIELNEKIDTLNTDLNRVVQLLDRFNNRIEWLENRVNDIDRRSV